MKNDRLIDVSTAAKILQVHTRTVYRHFDEGNLTPVKTGARKGLKVWRSHVIKLMESRGYH